MVSCVTVPPLGTGIQVRPYHRRKDIGLCQGQPFICQVSPEAAEGGPLAVVRDGDMIEMDVYERKLNLLIPDEELKQRIANWRKPPCRVKDGFLTVYARLANPCRHGAGINLRLDE